MRTAVHTSETLRRRLAPCGNERRLATQHRRRVLSKQEFTRQSEQENRIYTESRCVEGNFSLPGLVHGRRVEELAFSEGHADVCSCKGQ
jgi:hypothetical protein